MPWKSTYTDEIARRIDRNANGLLSKQYHIIPLDNKWHVILKGKKRTIRKFSTLREAKAFATRLAISKTADALVIHDDYGLVQERIVFNNCDS